MSSKTPKVNAKEIGWELKKFWPITVATVVVLLVIVAGFFVFRTDGKTNATIGSHAFELEIANTPKKKAVGLSGRAGLDDDKGMLFVFDEPGKHCFWMKDMRFSIDILWFDADRRLIQMENDVSPDTYPKSFCPSTNAQYVVELPDSTPDFEEGDILEVENL